MQRSAARLTKSGWGSRVLGVRRHRIERGKSIPIHSSNLSKAHEILPQRRIPYARAEGVGRRLSLEMHMSNPPRRSWSMPGVRSGWIS